MKTQPCPDCNNTIQIPADVTEGEIVCCDGCGLELVFSDGVLKTLVLDGDDWGE